MKRPLLRLRTHTEENREFLSRFIAWRQRHKRLCALKHASTFTIDTDLHYGVKILCTTQRQQFMGPVVYKGAQSSVICMQQARPYCQKYDTELRLSRFFA